MNLIQSIQIQEDNKTEQVFILNFVCTNATECLKKIIIIKKNYKPYHMTLGALDYVINAIKGEISNTSLMYGHCFTHIFGKLVPRPNFLVNVIKVPKIHLYWSFSEFVVKENVKNTTSPLESHFSLNVFYEFHITLVMIVIWPLKSYLFKNDRLKLLESFRLVVQFSLSHHLETLKDIWTEITSKLYPSFFFS